MAGRGGSRRAFTLPEVMIAAALLAIILMIVIEMLTSESRNTAQLIDDLAVNQQARQILQTVSRDVRDSHAIKLPEPGQVNPEPERVGLDETLGEMTLAFQTTSGDGELKLKRSWIRYRLVKKGEPAPPSIPRATPKLMPFGSGGEKWLFPVIRELWAEDPQTASAPHQVQLLGWVRSLSFYQYLPEAWMVSQPTVCVKLTMSAFKPNAGGAGFLETYREELSTGLTARNVLPAVVEAPPASTASTSDDPTVDEEGN